MFFKVYHNRSLMEILGLHLNSKMKLKKSLFTIYRFIKMPFAIVLLRFTAHTQANIALVNVPGFSLSF